MNFTLWPPQKTPVVSEVQNLEPGVQRETSERARGQVAWDSVMRRMRTGYDGAPRLHDRVV